MIDKRLIYEIWIIILILITVSLNSIYADHIPSSNNDIEILNRFVIIGKYDKWNPYFEIQTQYETVRDILAVSSYTLGTYYRLHSNLKIGAFYELQTGVRHDDDWKSLNPGWEWNDSRRYENVFMLDATPRLLLEIFDLKNTRASLKTRYFYNTYNDHQTVLLRPGLTYFHLKNRQPVFNISVNYNFYNALNFSEELIYEHGPYTSLIYHINRVIKLEGSVKYSIKKWTEGSDSKEDGDSYSIKDKKMILGIGIIITPF